MITYIELSDLVIFDIRDKTNNSLITVNLDHPIMPTIERCLTIENGSSLFEINPFRFSEDYLTIRTDDGYLIQTNYYENGLAFFNLIEKDGKTLVYFFNEHPEKLVEELLDFHLDNIDIYKSVFQELKLDEIKTINYERFYEHDRYFIIENTHSLSFIDEGLRQFFPDTLNDKSFLGTGLNLFRKRNDDDEYVMLDFESMGSGFQTLAAVFYYLYNTDTILYINDFIQILHPLIRKPVLTFMEKEAKKKNIKIIIQTYEDYRY